MLEISYIYIMGGFYEKRFFCATRIKNIAQQKKTNILVINLFIFLYLCENSVFYVIFGFMTLGENIFEHFSKIYAQMFEYML